MNTWLRERLACPRDHTALRFEADRCECDSGHRYPIVEGIPVFLIAETAPTHAAITRSLEAAQSARVPPPHPPAAADVDQFVQSWVAATCGNLYRPLIGKLTRYPIPRFPLHDGRDRILLDIGCNWGRWSIAAARNGFQAVGIDPDIEAVAAARRVAVQLGVDAAFVVADARALPFASDGFDAAFSYSVLQHFSRADADQSLAEIRRVLKPRGAALLQMANSAGIRSIYQRARHLLTRNDGFQVRYWNTDELVEWFRRHFNAISITPDGYFGLGIQPADLDLLPLRYRPVVWASIAAKACASEVPWLTRFADSVYVHGSKPIAASA